MLDFSSALYLGMYHPMASLRPWRQLTTGYPAAYSVPPESEELARKMARLTGCERATVGTSTLHIFWDLFGILAREPVMFFVEAGAYPIARWGVERAMANGAAVKVFERADLTDLSGRMTQAGRSGFRPVIVCDGLCPATGRPAPLADYIELARKGRGYVVVDDTQAFGILGHAPTAHNPYGVGGGGSPAWHGVQGPELIVASSLAKGLGVPIATLGGSRPFIGRFESESATRMHCSPPAIALIHAAQHAFEVNNRSGDQLRLRLLQLVRRFRARLHQTGLSSSGGLFPVQTLKAIPRLDAVRLHDRLLQTGVRTVLHSPRDGHAARISFLINALHRSSDIDDGIELLEQACVFLRCRTRGKEHESKVYL